MMLLMQKSLHSTTATDFRIGLLQHLECQHSTNLTVQHPVIKSNPEQDVLLCDLTLSPGKWTSTITAETKRSGVILVPAEEVFSMC